MSIRNLASVESAHSALSASFCVIGGGIAGLLVARRLSTAGHRVVVLESGYENFDDDIHRLNEIDDPSGRFSRALTGRYRGLGGSSTRWGGRMIPLNRHDTVARGYIGQEAWPFSLDQLDPYADDIETLFAIGPGSFETVPVVLGGKPAFPNSGTTLTPRWAKCPSFRRCNMATLLRQELMKDANVEIWLGATVCDFEISRASGRLRAVTARHFSGKTLKVSADDFIVACGTIESTRLLLLLDECSDRRIFAGCDALGHYLQDHLQAEVATIDRRNPTETNSLFGYRFVHSTRRDLHLELAVGAQEAERVASAYFFVAMDLDSSPLGEIKKIAQGLQRRELQVKAIGRVSRHLGLIARASLWRILRQQLFMPPGVELGVVARIEQEPVYRNRISLSHKRDRFNMPMARLDWAPTGQDERCFRSALNNLVAYWEEAGFERLCPLKLKPFALDPHALLTEYADDCAHPSGSTRMGLNPRTSVVGPDLRCHAISNVAIASASVFPTAGSANPTYTLMLLSLWLADSYSSIVSAKPASDREPVLA